MFKKESSPIKKKKKEEKPILPKELINDIEDPTEDIVFPDGFEEVTTLTDDQYLLIGETTASGKPNVKISIGNAKNVFTPPTPNIPNGLITVGENTLSEFTDTKVVLPLEYDASIWQPSSCPRNKFGDNGMMQHPVQTVEAPDRNYGSCYFYNYNFDSSTGANFLNIASAYQHLVICHRDSNDSTTYEEYFYSPNDDISDDYNRYRLLRHEGDWHAKMIARHFTPLASNPILPYTLSIIECWDNSNNQYLVFEVTDMELIDEAGLNTSTIVGASSDYASTDERAFTGLVMKGVGPAGTMVVIISTRDLYSATDRFAAHDENWFAYAICSNATIYDAAAHTSIDFRFGIVAETSHWFKDIIINNNLFQELIDDGSALQHITACIDLGTQEYLWHGPDIRYWDQLDFTPSPGHLYCGLNSNFFDVAGNDFIFEHIQFLVPNTTPTPPVGTKYITDSSGNFLQLPNTSLPTVIWDSGFAQIPINQLDGSECFLISHNGEGKKVALDELEAIFGHVVHDSTLTGVGILQDPLKVSNEFVQWGTNIGTMDLKDNLFNYKLKVQIPIDNEDVPYNKVSYRFNQCFSSENLAWSGLDWWSYRDGDLMNRYMAAIDFRFIVSNPATGANYARIQIKDGWYDATNTNWSSRVREMNALEFNGGNQIPSFNDFSSNDFMLTDHKIQIKSGWKDVVNINYMASQDFNSNILLRTVQGGSYIKQGLDWWINRKDPVATQAVVNVGFANRDNSDNPFAVFRITDNYGGRTGNRRLDALVLGKSDHQVPSWEDHHGDDFQLVNSKIRLKNAAHIFTIPSYSEYEHIRISPDYGNWGWDSWSDYLWNNEFTGILNGGPGYTWLDFHKNIILEKSSYRVGVRDDNQPDFLDPNHKLVIPMVSITPIEGGGAECKYAIGTEGSSTYYAVWVTWKPHDSYSDYQWSSKYASRNNNLVTLMQTEDYECHGTFTTCKMIGTDYPGASYDVQDVYEWMAEHEATADNTLTFLFQRQVEIENYFTEYASTYLANKIATSTVMNYAGTPLDGATAIEGLKGLSLEFKGTTNRLFTGFGSLSMTYSDMVQIGLKGTGVSPIIFTIGIRKIQAVGAGNWNLDFAFHDNPDSVYHPVSQVQRRGTTDTYVYLSDWTHNHEGITIEWKDYFLTIDTGTTVYNDIEIKSLYPEMTTYINELFLAHTSTTEIIVNNEVFKDLEDVNNSIPKNLMDLKNFELIDSNTKKRRVVYSFNTTTTTLNYFNIDLEHYFRASATDAWGQKGRISLGVEDNNNNNQMPYGRLATYAVGSSTPKRQLNALALSEDNTSNRSFVPSWGDFAPAQFKLKGNTVVLDPKIYYRTTGQKIDATEVDIFKVMATDIPPGSRLLDYKVYISSPTNGENVFTIGAPTVLFAKNWPVDGIMPNGDLVFAIRNEDTRDAQILEFQINYLAY